MNYILTILLVGFLILLHELGHFLAARLVKIPIAKFSIGFGPKIFGFKKGVTEYKISLIPVGGYVLPDIDDEKEFFEIPVYKRIIFSAGGVIANIAFPVLLFVILNIMSNGFTFSGVFIQPFVQTYEVLAQMIFSLSQIFTHSDQLSGIVGIVYQGKQFMGTDILRIMQFLIMISLNLAVVNLLPIPALDGGKIILYTLEKINKKLVKLHVPLSVAGWAIMIFLLVYTSYLDFGRYIVNIFA